MSLLHAFISAFALCVAIFMAWKPQAFIDGAGPGGDRKRSVVRFCGAIIIAATVVEAAVALLA